MLKWRSRLEELFGLKKMQRQFSGLPLSVKLKDCFTKREEEIVESKRRLVAIRRSEYHHLFSEGLVGPDAFRALVAAGNLELDKSSSSSTWANVSSSFDLPWLVQLMYNASRLTRYFAIPHVHSRMGFSFDATTTFLRASRTILNSDDFKTLGHFEVLQNEIASDCSLAEAYLKNLELAYPDFLLSFKTKICARAACLNEQRLAGTLHKSGRTEARENSGIINALRSSLKKVSYHPLRSRRAIRPAFLKSVSFLDCVALEYGLQDFSEKCEETIHRKGDEIIPSFADISSVVIVRHGVADVCKVGSLSPLESFESGGHIGIQKVGWNADQAPRPITCQYGLHSSLHSPQCFRRSVQHVATAGAWCRPRMRS